MSNIEIGITLLMCLAAVYYLLHPFIISGEQVNLHYGQEISKLREDYGDEFSNKERAALFLSELEDLKEQRSNALISEDEFLEQKSLLLIDAKEIL